MSDPRANIEITATSGGLVAGLRSAAARVHGFAGDVRKAMGVAGASVASSIGNIVGGLATRGFDVVTQQAKGVMDFERNLTRLGIAGSMSAGKMNDLRKAARQSSTDFGIGADQILAGTQTYVDLTGDIEGATGSMQTFTRVAQASGASVADIAQASAAFKGIGVPLEEMETTFSGLITQGKAGAVSLKDFAGELAGLAPRWAKFNEATTGSGIAQLGAAFQVARQGFGSASEAATGLQALMGALTQNAKKFAAAGVEVFDRHKDGSKTLKTFEQILSSIETSELVKDPTLMTKAMGSKEAEQTITMLLKARTIVGDGLVSDYGKLIDAGMDAGAVQRDLTTYLESSSGKMDKAWETVKNKIADTFTPDRIEAFANVMGKVASGVGKLVEGLGTVAGFLDYLNDSDEERGKRNADEQSGNNLNNKDYEEEMHKLEQIGAIKAKLAKDFPWAPSAADNGNVEIAQAAAMGQELTRRRGAAGQRAAAAAAAEIRDPWQQGTRNTGFGVASPIGDVTNFQEGGNAPVAFDAVAKEIRDGFSSVLKQLGVKLEVKIENETVAKANSKATGTRKAPH